MEPFACRHPFAIVSVGTVLLATSYRLQQAVMYIVVCSCSVHADISFQHAVWPDMRCVSPKSAGVVLCALVRAFCSMTGIL